MRWTLAPRGLAAYQRREAGARAWLSALLTDPAPEGWFQCRLEPGGQVASLYVPGRSPVPSACEFRRPGVGTGRDRLPGAQT